MLDARSANPLDFSANGRRREVRSRPNHLLTYLLASFVAALAFSNVARAQAAPQQAASKSASSPVPKHDLTGVWQYQGGGGADSMVPDKDMPPMTPWAKARFDTEKPGYGPRGAPGGNDPILQCDPIGFPRVMFMPTPNELVQLHDRVLQFWEREHEWRPIWTDGRPLPTDPDPTWFGYAIGHWEADDTFVVETAGFNDKTWLGPTGFPHSEEMRVTERYRRIDHDTILYNITVTDPKAYSKPIVAPQKTMKLKPHEEIEELPCVWSQENEFAKRIREPAAHKPAK
jgi:hypothetical protein